MTTHHPKRGRLLASTLLAVGCAASPPAKDEEIPFPPEYSTGQLRIATDFDAPLCAGDVALMDAQLRWLQQELDGARDEPTGIYLYAGEGPIGELAEGGLVAGYWDRPVVYAVWDAVSHELVHAAMSGVNEHVLTVLQEGFAVALSGSPQLQEENSREALGPALLEPFHHGIGSSGAYQSAGHFARWMFAEYGAQASVELYAGTAPGMTEDELSELWMDVVGVSLAEALNTYEARGSDLYPGLGPLACGQGESVAWDGDELAWEGELSCSDGLTYGRYYDNGEVRLHRRWRIEIPADGVHDVQFSGGEVALERCVPKPMALADLSWPQDQVVEDWWDDVPLYYPAPEYPRLEAGPHLLQAGVYDVWVSQSADETSLTFSISLRRM